MNDRTEWPNWLEHLRPDAVTRRRVKREIARESAPLLAARRGGWFEVASRWATILTPAAAAVTLLLAGMTVFRASPEIAHAPSRVEELVDYSGQGAIPTALVRDTLADLDVVMTAIWSEP